MDTVVKKKIKFVKVPIDDFHRLKSYVQELEWLSRDLLAAADSCCNLMYDLEFEESK